MIVCSCAVIRDSELRRIIAEMRAADPMAMITPGRVYHALGKRIRCHGCLPLIFEAIGRPARDAAGDETD